MDRSKMESLHESVLQRYLEACSRPDVSATMLQAAAKFLRDNGILLDATPSEPAMPSLPDTMPFSRAETA